MPADSKRKCRILIVEDDPVTRLALMKILAHLGHTIDPAATVAESLERLDGQDCAILDLNLPDGLGTVVLERIRNEGRPIRVAISSASTDQQLLARAQALSPEILLQKPINVTELIAWLDDVAG